MGIDLHNEFVISVSADRAWALLTDIPRIASCLPGAVLQDMSGEEYRGQVKVKVGPIVAQYRGVVRFVELDEVALRAVLRAEGRDARGQGTANALITATLTGDSGGTRTTVSVDTDLSITGKAAQFGRGVLAEVSARLMQQFVDNLEEEIRAAPDASSASDQPDQADQPELPDPPHRGVPAAPVDLVGVAAGLLLRRAARPSVLAGFVLVLALTERRWRRARRARGLCGG